MLTRKDFLESLTMRFKLSLLMALEIVLMNDLKKKKKRKIMTLAQIKKKEHMLRILFISLLMREPGR